MSALLRKAVTDVTRRKTRALLTILGIALGVLGLTALNTASNQMQANFLYTNSKASLPDIQLTTAPTSSTLVRLMQQQPNVELVQAQSNVTTRWVINSGHFPLKVVGVSDFSHVLFNTFQIVEGSAPHPGAQEIVVELSDRAVAPIRVGDQLVVSVSGQAQKFTISGIARTQGLPGATLAGIAQTYMDEQELEKVFHLGGVNTFSIRVHLPGEDAQTARQLTQFLEQRHVSVFSSTIGQSTFSNATKTDTLFSIISIVSIVALLLSTLLLISTISALVGEQFPIIGTMKAIGARRNQIMLNYLTSVAIYALIGTVIGLLLGLLVGYLLTRFLGDLLSLDIGGLVVEPATILTSVIVGLSVPLLAAILPVYIGTRITVRQALSGYGAETTSSRGKLARSAGLSLAFLPQTIHFGLSGLFRKRTRSILTLSGLTISAAVFLAVLTGVSCLQSTIEQIVDIYHYDVSVSFLQPVDYTILQQKIAPLAGVRRLEQYERTIVQTHWGQAQLTGMQVDTQLYHYTLLSGHWLSAGDQNMVLINNSMAQKLNLKVGDLLDLRDDLHSGSYRIGGILQDTNGVSPTTLGVIITSVVQVDRFLHVPATTVNALMIGSPSRETKDIDALATRVEDTLASLNQQANVQTTEQFKLARMGEVQSVAALLYIATAIVALVGAMSLFNSLAMSILERQREIGILQSMGATGGKIMQVFWTEGGILGLCAWLAALIIGLPIAYGFVQLLSIILAPLSFTFNPLYLVFMLVFILCVATLSSVGPALGAGKIKIAQTLRYE